MHSTVYLNDEFVDKAEAKVSVLDRGFLFADGVYEVVAVHSGKLFLMSEHVHRLNNSMHSLKFPPIDIDLQEVCEKLIEKNKIDDDAILYIQVTRGASDTRNHVIAGNEVPTVLCFTQSIALPTIDDLKVGFKAILREDIRWDRCNIKSTSLLPNILLKNEAKTKEAIECILHRSNIVTEGSASNVFIVKDSLVITPPKSELILPGITRDYLIEKLTAANIEIQESPIDVDELLSADEVWITSTTRDVTPIIQIDSTLINNGTVGPVWKTAIDLYRK